MWHDHDIDFARWLHPAMWLQNHDSEFTKWQHPTMWHVALGWHAVEFAQWQHPAMWHVALGSWHWICQVAAPCNVAGGSGMTCHGIHPNVCHIGILHLVSILTMSPQSSCHSAPVCEILSKLDHPPQKKMTSCQFSRWRISAVLDFRGPIMGSLKSPCTTSYRSSIHIITLNCLLLRKSCSSILATDEQMDRPVAWSRSCCRERRLNNTFLGNCYGSVNQTAIIQICQYRASNVSGRSSAL